MELQKRILIIDDDVDFRNLLRIQLSLAGYSAEVAEDGLAGGKAMLEHPPDLVLSDIHMPFLNGVELLSLMGTDEHTASIPVILLSGQSDGATALKAKRLGAADFLTKPVAIEHLLNSIRGCLQRKNRNEDAAPQML
jgi:DNA-binding NtrC family response regulator